MTFIGWAFLNLLVLFSLCFILFRALKPRVGSIWAYISVFIIIGIIGVLNRQGGEETKDGKVKSWQLAGKDSVDQNYTASTETVMDKNPLHNYTLGIQWSNRKGTETQIPASAY